MDRMVYLATESNLQISLLEKSISQYFLFKTIAPVELLSNPPVLGKAVILIDMAVLSRNETEHLISVLVVKFPNASIALFNTDRSQCIQIFFEVFDIRGVFYSDDSFNTLLKGIALILNGEHWVSRKILTNMLEYMRVSNKTKNTSDFFRAEELTPREKEILGLVATGATNTEIAEQIFLSENTVKTHLSNLYRKLDIRNRTQATAWVKSRAWIQ